MSSALATALALSLQQFLASPEAPKNMEPARALVTFARETAKFAPSAPIDAESLVYDSKLQKWTLNGETLDTLTPWTGGECRNENDMNLRRECLRREDHLLSAIEDSRAEVAGNWADDLIAECDEAVLQERLR